MNRKFNLWLAGFLVILMGVVLWGRASWEICWDGLEVDEPLLLELCGITEDEYFSSEFDPVSCPEAEQAVYMVGGCDTDWSAVITVTAWVGGAYLLLSGIGFAIWRMLNKPNKL
jgi:hypothetical protein